MKPFSVFLFVALSCVFISHSATARQQADTNLKQDTVVKPASFPGGIDGWRRYLEGNLTYPKKAVKKNTQGLVRVQMEVDAKGNVTAVKALNDPGNGLAAEAERVIKVGPKWIPASQNGKNVPFRFVQSITFQLQ